MSGGLAPSKSTVYFANFSFSFTNNDLHKTFEPFGRVIKVSIVKDRVTRKSTGVAFILFQHTTDAEKAVAKLDQTEFLGRKVICRIAKDNGRTKEFIRRKEYPDKTRCYECGDYGHLSYTCSKNALGERIPAKPRKRKKSSRNLHPNTTGNDKEANAENPGEGECESGDTESDYASEPEESLGAAIQSEHTKVELDNYRLAVATGNYEQEQQLTKRKRVKKSAYFSDEDETEDD